MTVKTSKCGNKYISTVIDFYFHKGFNMFDK